MFDETDEPLIQEISPALEIDHQYVRAVDGWNQDLVEQIRRCGRAAGRRLGYRMRTLATDPTEREDGRVVVWVVVTRSDPGEEERLRQRSELLMRQTFNHLLE
jgi:hypothetical protein